MASSVLTTTTPNLRPDQTAPARGLSTSAALSIVIGSVLGSGIFVAPSLVASFSTSIWVMSLLWLLGGLACAAGAVIYGGLGLKFPQGGGQYIYLRETMGSSFSSFYGWASLLVICPTMLAGTSLYFSYLCQGVSPTAVTYGKAIAVGLLVLMTILNSYGLRLAGSLQKFLVFLHVALFIGVMGLGYYFLPSQNFSNYTQLPQLADFSLRQGIVAQALLAFAAILWTFDGFNAITFVTNEIEGGERNIRKIALVGCAIVFVLYLLFNFVVLANIAPEILVHETNAASYLASAVFGQRALWVVFLLTTLGIATVLHSSIIIGPRLMVATLRDSRHFQRLAGSSKNLKVPPSILWLQCLLAIGYVLIGHFTALITAFAVLNWLFYGITAFGFYKVRAEAYRLNQITGQAFTFDLACVGLFMVIVATLLASQFLSEPKTALLLTLLIFLRKKHSPVEVQVGSMQGTPSLNILNSKEMNHSL